VTIPPHHDPACWGCGDNAHGIRLPLPAAEGAEAYDGTFRFDERHQGGPGIAHGGLVAAALDEACSLLATWHRFPTVTARFALRYRRPIPINVELRAGAQVVSERGRRIEIRGELHRGDELLAEAEGSFLHVPLEHFLQTPEGRVAAENWRRTLDAG
jgi:acyl-coenzyme A thioesterase PaaI-like protein